MDKQIDTEKKDTYNSIKDIMNKARKNVSKQVNNIIIQSYWEIGRIIVEDEQGNSDRAEYGRQLTKVLWCAVKVIFRKISQIFSALTCPMLPKKNNAKY